MAGKNKRIGATLVLSEGNFFTNVKKASSGIKDLKKNFDSNAASVTKHNSAISSAGDGLASLAKKALGVVSAYAGVSAIWNFGKDAVKTGMEFEQGMAQVQAISGATGSEFTALRDKAKEMGATTKFTAIESAEAMKYMGMAGWNSAQMIDGIAGIMNLAAASGEQLGSVSDIVTDSLTAFGLKAADSAHFADVLAMAATKSNTNVSMLGESFKFVAPVAGAMGYTFEDTTTALGIMANSGIKASEAGTSLRSVMTRLAKPTKEVYKAFDALNLQATNSDGSMKSLSTLVPELQTKFRGLTAEEKGRYATMLAGKNAMSGLLALVNASTDDWNSLSSSIANADGTAQSMADTMNDTVSGKLTLLQSQFEGVKIAMFDGLGSSKFKDAIGIAGELLTDITPTLNNIAIWLGDRIAGAIEKTSNTISWLKNNLNSLSNSLSYLSPVIYGVVGAIGTYNVITGIKNGLTAISVATTGLEAEAFAGLSISQLAAVSSAGLLTSAQTALNAAFIASPIGWIVVGIGLVIAAVVLLYKKCSWFRDFVHKMFKSVTDWMKSTWSEIKSSLAPLVAAIKGAFEEALGAIEAFWNIVKPYFVMGWNNIKAILSVVSVHLKGLFGILGAYIKARIKMAIALFTAVWSTIRGIFSVVKSVLTGDWQGAWEGIKGIVGAWVAYFRTVWEGIKSVFASVVNWFGNTFAAAWEAIKAVFSNVTEFFQSIWNIIKKMFDAVGITISESISAKFKSTLNAVFSFAGGLINKFIRGINWAVDKINAIPGVSISRLSEVNIPMLAKGGVIQRAGNVIVGERGPEMLRLPRGASVTPLPAGMTAGGGTYNNTFYVTVNADDSNSAERFVRRVKEILDNM